MCQSKSMLTVFFENPFWVGLYEREVDGKYEVCKITFGAEPKDYEVYQFFLDNWRGLRFSPGIEATAIDERRQNPKRMQREVKKAIQNTGIGTKAQQALKLQQEQGKLAQKKGQSSSMMPKNSAGLNLGRKNARKSTAVIDLSPDFSQPKIACEEMSIKRNSMRSRNSEE